MSKKLHHDMHWTEERTESRTKSTVFGVAFTIRHTQPRLHEEPIGTAALTMHWVSNWLSLCSICQEVHSI